MTVSADFPAQISEHIWDLKYRLRSGDGTPVDLTIEDTFRRVAKAAARSENGDAAHRAAWEQRFF